MSNKSLFKSNSTAPAFVKADVTNTVNNAGGNAYLSDNKHKLAQIACTNCFNGTFYVSAEQNLKLAKEAALALTDDPQFIAKVALYAREKGYMKDMPAFLTVVLADLDKVLFRKVFRKVIDNGKMLRNAIQMGRSGAVTGKKFNMSSGTWRHAIQEWFAKKSPRALFKASIGQDPSMRDILRMSRPRPVSPEQSALFGYFLGKEGIELESLPEAVREYELWKKNKTGPVPDVDFRFLDSLGLSDANWTEIARNAPWMMTRMNLNTFARHNVFNNDEVTSLVADRLQNPEEVEKSRAFPYQLYSAWAATDSTTGLPFKVRAALNKAMELAINNVPEIKGNVHVCVDCSGSMGSPVTGSDDNGRRHVSSVTCVQVAGLIASSVVRKNPEATVWTFSHDAVRVKLNPLDTVISNTQKLSKAGGGTNVSAPLRKMNAEKIKADVVIYVSDYESWIDKSYGSATALAQEWKTFKARNPKAKLICIDLTPNVTSQVQVQPDVLQVGGFSDAVYDVMASFVKHGSSTDHWVSEIEKIEIE